MNDYIRDGRSPEPLNNNVSVVMSANKAKDTKPELLVRKRLFQLGIRGYRLHKKDIPGRPDLCFTKKRLAVFINGCYWHRCPYCELPFPKTNTEFWQKKFDANIKRDKNNISLIENMGWNVLVIWECEVLDINRKVRDLNPLLLRIAGHLSNN